MKFSLVEFDKAYKEEVKKLIKETLKSYGFLIDKEREKIIDEFVEKNYPLESHHYEEIVDEIISIYKDKVFYVWFDAPIGYLTNTIYASERLSFDDSLEEALKKIKGKWKNWFANSETKIIHFIGKDNIPFHTTFWPGMIISFNKSFIEDIIYKKEKFEPNEKKFLASLSIEKLKSSFQEYLINKLSEKEREEFWKNRDNPEKIKELLNKLDVVKELKNWLKSNNINVKIKEENDKIIIKETLENCAYDNCNGKVFECELEFLNEETNLFDFLAYLLNKEVTYEYPHEIKFRKTNEKEIIYKQLTIKPYEADFLNSISLENLSEKSFQYYLLNKLSEEINKKINELKKEWKAKEIKELINKNIDVLEEFKKWLKENEFNAEIKEEKGKLIIEDKNREISDYKAILPFLAYLLGKEIKYICPEKIKKKRINNKILTEKLNLPYNVVGYNYLNYEGQKFSKSQGTGIFLSPENLPVLKEIPIDAWRFYLISILPEQKDSDFSWQDFEEKYNKELLGNFANFVYRVLSFAKKNNLLKADLNTDIKELEEKVNKEKVKESLNREEFKELKEKISSYEELIKNKSFIHELSELTKDEKLRDKIFEFAKEILEEKFIDFLLFTLLYKIRNNLIQKYEEKMNPDNVKLKEALQIALKLSDIGNKQFQKFEPWKKIKENREETEKFIVTMLNYVYSLAYLIYPFMPKTAEKIAKMLNIKIEKFDNAYLVIDNFELGEIEHLLEKVDFNKVKEKIDKSKEKAKKENKKGEKMEEGLISIDDFFKVKLRVGKIINVEEPKELKKLYKLTVAFDKEGKETKTILAGLKNYYKPEELKGRIVIVVYNLKPKKVAGYVSEGMLLAAEKNGKLDLATVNNEDLIGAYLS